ncbi:MAG: hypothetical protein FWG87_12605 [Defluviitaleaceae bacterium]|nr:hypothetical protein [Defluviitaleaceae bacterium]
MRILRAWNADLRGFDGFTRIFFGLGGFFRIEIYICMGINGYRTRI